MATFTVDDADLEELIRRDLWQGFKYQAPLPGGALAAAALLGLVHPILGAVALGMGIAWTYSLVMHLRNIRPWYRSHHGSLAGPITVEFVDEGIMADMPLGGGILRWNQLSSIRLYPGHFVIESDGEEILILPKRHFSTEELALLHSKALEIERRPSAG